MQKREVRNPLALAVLSCLCQRPMHPYEMSRTMREQHHDSAVKLNFGSLYSVVEALARAGYIEQAGADRQGGRPQRTIYRITETGQGELREWLQELLSEPTKEYTLFAAGLTFMTALSPAQAATHLQLRAERLQDSIEKMRAALLAVTEPDTGRGVAHVFLVEDDYQLAMKVAELDFVRKLIREISSGAMSGVDEWQSFHH